MTIGWVRLHRKILESSLFQNHNAFIVFSACLMLASHEKKKFPFNGSDVEIEPGEFITGIYRLSEQTCLSPRKVRTALDYLKTTSRLTIKTSNKFSLVKINKWVEYQTNDKHSDKQMTNKRQTNDYNQELKELKNYNSVAEATNLIQIGLEKFPMEELTYEPEFTKKKKSKHGSQTMAQLVRSYADITGVEIRGTFDGGPWATSLSTMYQ